MHVSIEVAQALELNRAVVALESAVITHGLPYPENLNIALGMEAEVRAEGVVPATTAVFHGHVCVGLTEEQLKSLAQGQGMRKLGARELAIAVVRGESGGTTVSATAHIAHQLGIRVFATGGIGGVHRQPMYDISADLPKLAHTPIVLVCSGAKSILHLPATLEYLETHSILLLGYHTRSFPAFYAADSGLEVSDWVESPEEVAKVAKTHWRMGATSAVLVLNPVPAEHALNLEQMEAWIEQAQRKAEQRGVHGQEVTPFLLKCLHEYSQGASLRANLALLRVNARLAAQIARHLASDRRLRA